MNFDIQYLIFILACVVGILIIIRQNTAKPTTLKKVIDTYEDPFIEEPLGRYTLFNPWDEASERKAHSPIGDLVEFPPCLTCKHWKPVRDEEENDLCQGIILCHSQTQYTDFSCYHWKGAK